MSSVTPSSTTNSFYQHSPNTLNTPISPAPPLTLESLSFSNTYIQRARPYLTASQISGLLPRPGSQDEARHTSARLSASMWIVSVGRACQVPVRTIATALLLFSRLLLLQKLPTLLHSWTEAAAASLFLSCKLSDTLIKSREILAASFNLPPLRGDPITPDSPLLDDAARKVIPLERLLLETTSFDFRVRHAFPFVTKLSRRFGLSKSTSHLAWRMALDAYRTFAVLRHTPHAIALASILLATQLTPDPAPLTLADEELLDLCTCRADILSITDDLLDLYTNHTNQSTIGTLYSFTEETFLNLRIEFNRERKSHASNSTANEETNGEAGKVTPVTTILKDRGISGTVRFMIDPEREKREWEMLVAAPDGGMGRSKPVETGGGVWGNGVRSGETSPR